MKKGYFAGWVISMTMLCIFLTTIKNNAQCTANQLPQDKYVFAEYPEGEAPHSTNVIVSQYEPGIMYTLRRDADNSIVAGPQSGAIGLFVPDVTETTVYHVLGRNPASGCERQMSTKPVITIISSDPPSCTLPADRQLVVEDDSGQAPHSTYIYVQDPQPGILYSLRIHSDNAVIDCPQPGTEPLFTGEVHQTTEYNVLAHDPQTQCEIVLSTRPVVTIVSNNPDEPVLHYPDLFSWSKPGSYMYDVQVDKKSGQRLLRFSVASANKGAGPLELRATVQSDGTTTATQRIYDNQGGYIDRHAGTFVFSGHADHNHFHLVDFANYRLREVLATNAVGSVIRSADKISFAIFDVSAYDLSLPGAPSSRVYTNPSSSLDAQGISVGWADVYPRTLSGQAIDIMGVPNGEYWLEVTIDPSGLITESDESNNTTYVKVILQGNRATTNMDQPSNESFTAARTTPHSGSSRLMSADEMDPEQIIVYYPNPSQGEFDVVIEDDYTGLYYLQVRDLSGRTLEKQTIMKEGEIARAHIDLTKAGEGIYVLCIYRNGKAMNKKIVVSR
jgi:hypothetical protein